MKTIRKLTWTDSDSRVDIKTGVSIGQTRDAVVALEGLLGLDLIGHGSDTRCSTKL